MNPKSQSPNEALARTMAAQLGVEPALVCAVCEQESGWDPWAIRYEPEFLERYVPILLPATERTARAISWGLMQIMGEVAREEGYAGHLPQLCEPATGLNAGIKHLKRQLARAGGDVAKALLLWNGGANPEYPGQVLARLANYQRSGQPNGQPSGQPNGERGR